MSEPSLWELQQEFVKNAKGAGVSVILILLFSGRSLTNEELQVATGYGDKSITKALGWLEPRGYVQYNGRLDGWSLGRGLAQLPLSPEWLGELVFLLTGKKGDVLGDGLSVETGNAMYPKVVNYDLTNKEIVNYDLFSLGGGLNINLLNQGSNQPPPTNQKRSYFTNSAEIIFWLTRAGISPKSPKGKAILGLGLATEEVKRTVLQVEYERREWLKLSPYDRHRLNMEHEPSTGRAIYRLSEGMVLWPERCVDCLEEPAFCRCDEVETAVDPLPRGDPEPPQAPPPVGSDVWRATLAELQLQMTRATFEAWLRDTRVLMYEAGVMVIAVCSEQAKDWLENRLADTIRRTLCALAGCTVDIRFEVEVMR